MKSKSFLTILGLVVAMLLLISFNSISESFTQNFDSSLGDGIFSVRSSQLNFNSIDEIGISENQLESLNELKYVNKLIPIYSKFIKGNFSNNNILELVFLNSSVYNDVGIKIFEGHYTNSSSEIIIGVNYKEISKKQVGDYLRFNNETYKIVGVFTGNMNYLNSIIVSSDAIIVILLTFVIFNL